jgi:hypothetical protein
MSTRRAVRPDGQVYRQTRRLGGRRRRPASLFAAYVCLAIVVLGMLILWWVSHRH